jgi:hypothetical protein
MDFGWIRLCKMRESDFARDLTRPRIFLENVNMHAPTPIFPLRLEALAADAQTVCDSLRTLGLATWFIPVTLVLLPARRVEPRNK